MQNNVVALQELEPGIVQMTMQDHASKNGFTPELTAGLVHAFMKVKENPDWKVVILTGYDNYFASGGTKAALMWLQEGEGTFADVNLYSLALDCEIPVISAMQGHAIGGGFVMGMYADMVILGRECVYTTNFMKYGFTPGMGATYILTKKLGIALAQEMLTTADNYRGATLAQRGVPFAVVPRTEVLAQALELSRSIAAKPRKSLVALKRHMVTPLRQELPGVIEQELAMHEITFHDNEIKERIATLFGN
jgi:polyketide biosynthesis enoyl-CoA hydratase PksI